MVHEDQDFCLKWNNFHSSVSATCTKLWLQRTFIDITLVMGNQSIGCHKVILSACSTYFEEILTAHEHHQHPLILLPGITFQCMEKLVTFMYCGEVNIQQDEVTDLLNVANRLKIKGLAEHSTMAQIRRSMDISEIPEMAKSDPSTYNEVPVPTTHATSSTSNPDHQNIYSSIFKAIATAAGTKRNMIFPTLEGLNHFPTKRRRTTNSPSSSQTCNNTGNSLFAPKCSPSSLPASSTSPPISAKERHYDESPKDLSRTATPEQFQQEPLLYMPIKQEIEEETDNELQIDESAGQSPSDGTSTESDTGTHSNQNTPVPDTDSRDSLERTETAHSLAAMASQVSPFSFFPQETTNYFTSKTVMKPQTIPKKKAVGGARNGERAYTNKDLELGIELVISGSLTPALAIKRFHVPRRTFFRRLSAVRQDRGIKPSKDGNYMTARRKSTEVKLPTMPSLVVNDNVLNLHRNGLVTSKVVDHCRIMDENKKIAASTVMSLLNLSKNNNYNYFLKAGHHPNLNGLSSSSDDKENPRITPVIDNNSNLANTNHNLSDTNIILVDPNRPLADTNGTVEECS